MVFAGSAPASARAAIRRHWPALAGTVAGVLLAGLPGAAAGFLLGGAAAYAARRRALMPMWWWGLGLEPGVRQLAAAVFALAGRLAKADGRVSEAEIAATEAAMGELGLPPRARRRARAAFRAGRDCQRPPLWLLAGLRRKGGSTARRRRCLALLVQIAAADGAPGARQHRLLVRVAARLGEGPETVLGQLRAHRPGAPPAVGSGLAAAYRRLGIAPAASDAEVTRAYRQVLAREHPDRVEGAGGAPEAVRAAAQRVAELRGAYDRIREARGRERRDRQDPGASSS